MNRKKIKRLKIIALFTAFSLIYQIVFPTIVLALTSGPKSPEFMSFTPVATTNMVDLVTGDFNYNIPVIEIPGSEGGGYALSLSYNSGVNSEQEASWVGFGWNINPGAIDRNMRGFPDDYSGEPVKIYNKTRPTYSMTTANNYGIEAFSIEVGVDKSLRFNSHYGFFSSTGLSLQSCGIGLGINFDPNGVTYSANINVHGILSKQFEKAAGKQLTAGMTDILLHGSPGNLIKGLKAYRNSQIFKKSGLGGSLNTGLFTFSDACRATTFKASKGLNVNFNFGVNFDPAVIPLGPQIGKKANFNISVGEFETNGMAFGYFNDPLNTSGAIMDYYVEKSSDNNKRDIFIGMPFTNADIFGVTGEGLSGGFRGYKDNVENYSPAKPNGGESKVVTINEGLDISVGSNFGVGLTLGGGSLKTTLKDWGGNSHLDNSLIFRFNNDLGGKITYGNNNNELERASISYDSNIPGFKSVNLNDSRFNNIKLNSSEAGSSSYIDYHTHGQIKSNSSNSFTKQYSYISAAKIPINDNCITEYSIYNENGDNFVYGVPVFARNETSISFDINSTHTKTNRFLAFRGVPISKDLEGKYSVTETEMKSDNNRSVLGEIKNSPYVCNYLLSQITQPNFIDINNNGPDESDYGGWTKFNYRKIYGSFSESSEKWYRYRSPYNGLHYSQNSISDQKDDLGSVVTGEKEVHYLQTIETKTHIAFFVTNKYEHKDGRFNNVGNGSGKKRMDARGAKTIGIDDPSGSETVVSAGDNELEYLEKIVLFSKARPEKPIKVVYFDYDYSLVPNLPNNENSSFSYGGSTLNLKENSGKLTLKKVWFEYEGAAPAKISPYIFSYVYAKSSSVKSGTEFFDDYDALSNQLGGAQNPSYNPHLLDPWGNIMPYARERQSLGIPWRYQGLDPEFRKEDFSDSWRNGLAKEDFDPAAWHLKSITLPSGGEIHIQYEDKDYTYVQDQPVMGMASLIQSSNTYDNPWFDINVDDLGCDHTNQNEIRELASKINDMYGNDTEETPGKYADKVYFKFLYDLISENDIPEPNLDNPNAEYITGYAAFSNAEVFPANNPDRIRIYLASYRDQGRKRTTSPRQAAYDFLVNQRQGLLKDDRKKGLIDYEKTFESTTNDLSKGLIYNDLSFKNVNGFLFDMIKVFTLENPASFFNYSENNVCNAVSHPLSFLKMPMYKSKKGGGARVKRLLMYDSGIDNTQGDAQVLGQEFHYVLDDGLTSSGVACNEPSSAREENPLVKYMIRNKQTLFSRLTAGEDKEQTEGPLGESLLPAAAIYFSRVVVENIHSDKSNSGFTVHEFYTTKDFPFNGNYGCRSYKNESGGKEKVCSEISGQGVEFTILDNNSRKDDFLPPIPMVFFSYGVNKVWMAQGFRFVQNSMNGLVKRVSVFGGKYNRKPVLNGKDIDTGYLVSMNQNDYYLPGEKITMLKPNATNGYEVYLDTPGKEMEIINEGKELSNNAFNLDISFDFTIGMAGIFPVPFLPVVPSVGINSDLIATHATTKVIRYPAILKSQTVFQDGVTSKTEYLAFNAFNGQPLITKTYDGYANKGLVDGNLNNTKVGEIYQFVMPANWKYEGMGPKSKDITYTNQLSAQTLNITTYGNPPSPSWFDGSATSILNVLGVSVNTYEKNWNSSWNDVKIKSDFNLTTLSETVKNNLNSIWRNKASYVYKSDKTVSQTNTMNYQKGYYAISKMFNWSSVIDQNGWLKVSEIKKYSPHSSPLEEWDVMNIPSAVLYGNQYGNLLPVMVAQNAAYDDIYFNDCEGLTSGTSGIAHSGKLSALYSNNMTLISGIYVTKHLIQKGATLKLWAAPGSSTPLPDKLNTKIGLTPGPTLTKESTSGLWSLYSCKIEGSLFPSKGNSFSITADGNTGITYVDDVRFQPSDAQASCFVYDKQTFKLLTQFDDQHFGMYYQYNDEGALTHKIVETERGLKTIQETQYNIPKVAK